MFFSHYNTIKKQFIKKKKTRYFIDLLCFTSTNFKAFVFFLCTDERRTFKSPLNLLTEKVLAVRSSEVIR